MPQNRARWPWFTLRGRFRLMMHRAIATYTCTARARFTFTNWYRLNGTDRSYLNCTLQFCINLAQNEPFSTCTHRFRINLAQNEALSNCTHRSRINLAQNKTVSPCTERSRLKHRRDPCKPCTERTLANFAQNKHVLDCTERSHLSLYSTNSSQPA